MKFEQSVSSRAHGADTTHPLPHLALRPPATLQPSPQNEFIFSPRLDNLFSSFAAVEGLIASCAPASWGSDGRISMIALWDNEEVGSVSAYGAQSNFIEATIERVAVAMKKDGESATEAYQRSLASSFLLRSALSLIFDGKEKLILELLQLRHGALGPPLVSSATDLLPLLADHHAGRFMDKHEENHRPLVNSGPAIKTNAKQRYASTAQTTFALRRCAQLAGVPLQEYEVRNDMACGSTSEPLLPTSHKLHLPRPRPFLEACTLMVPSAPSRTSRLAHRTPNGGHRMPAAVDALDPGDGGVEGHGVPHRALLSSLWSLGPRADGFWLPQDLFETFFDKFGTVDNLNVD